MLASSRSGEAYADACESEELALGSVHTVTSPSVVHAVGLHGAFLNELVRVGESPVVLGEVVSLHTIPADASSPSSSSSDGSAEQTVAVIELYEHVDRIAVGDPVRRTGSPLCLELGPGLIGSTCDGLLRPLDEMAGGARLPGQAQQPRKVFVPAGTDERAMNRDVRWQFTPAVELGDVVRPGDVFGIVTENSLFTHQIMLPPDAIGGMVTFIAREQDCTITEELLEIEEFAADAPSSSSLSSSSSSSLSSSSSATKGRRRRYTMMQRWPVRKARPMVEKRSPNVPLLTGLRIIDALFPCAVGGTAAVIHNQTYHEAEEILSWVLARHSNADVQIWVDCGLHSVEKVEIACQLSEITITINGQHEAVMKRSLMISTPANATVTARRASLHSGLLLAEYFRDQGYHVLLLLSSLSQYLEAGHEQRTSPLNLDASDYARTLTRQLAPLYDRAGRVRCIGSPARDGAITMIGMVGCFGPFGSTRNRWLVGEAVEQIAQAVWFLDRPIVQRGYYMPFSCLESRTQCFGEDGDLFSRNRHPIEDYLARHVAEDFPQLRRTCLEIFRREQQINDKIKEESRSLRKDPMEELSEADRFLINQMAKWIREDFLCQNVFSPSDMPAHLYKSAWMLRNYLLFYQLTRVALTDGPIHDDLLETVNGVVINNYRVKRKEKMTWQQLKTILSDDLVNELCCQRFWDIDDGDHRFVALHDKIKQAFSQLDCFIMLPSA